MFYINKPLESYIIICCYRAHGRIVLPSILPLSNRHRHYTFGHILMGKFSRYIWSICVKKKREKKLFFKLYLPAPSNPGSCIVFFFFDDDCNSSNSVITVPRAYTQLYFPTDFAYFFFFFLSPSRGRKVYEQSETSIHQSDLTAPGQVGTFYSACALVHVNIAWLGQWEPHIARLPFRININNKRGKEKEAVFYSVCR